MRDFPTQHGEASQAILQRLERIREQDAPTHGGRVFSYVYDSGLAQLDALAADAARLMQSVNGLDPTTFPSVAQLEKEVLQFTKGVLNAPATDADRDNQVYGSVTSGGTASCLLAVKSARDLWRKQGGIGVPTIVAPSTVHAAFHKAAQYFGLELILVPVDVHSRRVSAEAILEQCGEQTALIVLSAPNYPFGTIDPVVEVATVAQKQGISLHVDACFGGFVLPWWQSEGEPWDFRVPGVTSISADLHKYGYAPKGVSTLLQRGLERHRTQYFATKNWPGYPVVNATLVGSRPAGPLASSWAIVQYLGEDGFRSLTRKIQQATERLSAFFRDEVVGLRLAAQSQGPVVVIETDTEVPESDRIDPHLMSDHLRLNFGWISQAQPGLTQSDGSVLPPTTHFTMTPVSLTVMDDLLADVRQAADQVRGQLRPSAADFAELVPAAVVERLMSGELLSTDEISALFALLGLEVQNSHSSVLPNNYALLMTLIETLPAPVVEQVLIEVLARQVEGDD